MTQLAWSPSHNLLAWVDSDGVLTRWQSCVPPDGVDPVKLSSVATSKTLPPATKRKGTPGLFDFDLDEPKEKRDDVDMDAVGDLDGMDNDDWILDDLDGAMDDDDEKVKDLKLGGAGIREMGGWDCRSCGCALLTQLYQ